MKVFCIEVGEKYKDELRYKLIWDRLTNYARQRNEEKSNDKFVSLSMDDPAITPIDKCRFCSKGGGRAVHIHFKAKGALRTIFTFREPLFINSPVEFMQ